ncbi:RNA polymerase sigma-70 factor, ECF subfamily [Chitinophaga costaii]|uniref:RNA polymerase sigma-70 factor, ECF subfamily n=1 Tax=Chitinophaga costaii TaxID=1335309 RepID=A0A1C3YXS7_9BACT|nr:RNA polymerase sigma-70 factor [Chitinophaga costaii]PUZ30144.1 RNA polymerase sigma-70 factor [Chitinophaga costaii]SCB74853.1 RNA polymerase sigma-70 factor, ECF subfamily [Chitinophaga costaii]
MSVDTSVGEKVAFTRLYAQHFQAFTLLALQYVKDVVVAEDIVQDAFLKFWEMPFKIDNPHALKSYFGRIIINNALNYLKRAKNLQRHHDEISKKRAGQDVLAQIHESELKVLVYKEIEHLPGQCKKVFKMNRFEGMKYREIAAVLQISERTVENHIAYALKVLRKKLLTEDNEFKANLQQYKVILLLLS